MVLFRRMIQLLWDVAAFVVLSVAPVTENREGWASVSRPAAPLKCGLFQARNLCVSSIALSMRDTRYGKPMSC